MLKTIRINHALDNLEEYATCKIINYSNPHKIELEKIVNDCKNYTEILKSIYDIKKTHALNLYLIEYVRGKIEEQKNEIKINEKNKKSLKRNILSDTISGTIGLAFGLTIDYLLNNKNIETTTILGTAGATAAMYIENTFEIIRKKLIDKKIFSEYSKEIGTQDYFKNLRKKYVKILKE